MTDMAKTANHKQQKATLIKHRRGTNKISWNKGTAKEELEETGEPSVGGSRLHIRRDLREMTLWLDEAVLNEGLHTE